MKALDHLANFSCHEFQDLDFEGQVIDRTMVPFDSSCLFLIFPNIDSRFQRRLCMTHVSLSLFLGLCSSCLLQF